MARPKKETNNDDLNIVKNFKNILYALNSTEDEEGIELDDIQSIKEFILEIEKCVKREIEEISKNTGVPISAYMTTAKMVAESKNITILNHLIEVCNHSNFPADSWRLRWSQEAGSPAGSA